jgi:hypothetical protein
MRVGMMSRSPRQHDPILLNLYNQALQMGLPQDVAMRILSIHRRTHTSSAYGNPAYGSPAAAGDAYGPSAPSYGSSPYRPRLDTDDFPQLPAAQSANVDYHCVEAPQMSEQTSSATPQTMMDGTTYYLPNQPGQAMVPYQGGASAEPIFGQGYSQNYEYGPYPPLNPIPETAGTQHHYAHELYGPEMYAGEQYIPESYPRQPAYGHGHPYYY